MKKMICLLLFVAVLLSCTAFADEAFTLHSGVTFGMSAQEVTKLETAKGFIPEAGNGYLYVTGKVAGFDNSMIRYYIASDSVFSALYRIGVSSTNRDTEMVKFQTVQKSLESKYGAPAYSHAMGTYTSLPGTYKNQNVTGFIWAKAMTAPFLGITWKVEDYYQWELTQPDGSVILIDHYFMNDSGSYVEWISYVCYDAKDINVLNKKTEAMSDDL